MKAQIEVGELLQAFDIAARVPDGPTPPQKTGQLEASLNARNAALKGVLQLLLQQKENSVSLSAPPEGSVM